MVKNLKYAFKVCLAVLIHIRTLITLNKILPLDGGVLYFSRYSRLYNYYKGVKSRLAYVFYTYGITKEVLFEIKGKTVVDIGANIGEFSVFLRKYTGHSGKIIAFEPDPHDFITLSKNAEVYDLIAMNYAVSDVTGNVDFILNNENADSRLGLLDNEGDKKVSVQSYRLTDILEKLTVNEVGLIKIEAEGFEPEVLQGLDLSNISVSYIAIDCGPERPPNNSTTLVGCLNYLFENNYKLVNYNSHRHSVLLKRIK